MKKLNKNFIKDAVAGVGFVAVIFSTVMIVLYLLSPHEIESSFQGVFWRNGDQTEVIPSELHINGKKKKNRISGEVEFTLDNEVYSCFADIIFLKNGIGYISNGVVLGEEAGRLIGCIVLDDKEERFSILIYEDSQWSGDGGLIFTAPAESRDEAVYVMRELSQNFDVEWLLYAEWR